MSSPQRLFGRRADLALGLVVVALVALLFWVSWFGGSVVADIREAIQRAIPAGDKVGHFVLYGAISFFAALRFRRTVVVAVVSLLIFGLGVFDEIRQMGEADRSVSATDLLANGCGIVAGVVAARVILHLWTSREMRL